MVTFLKSIKEISYFQGYYDHYDKEQKRWRRKWVFPLHHSKKYQYQISLLSYEFCEALYLVANYILIEYGNLFITSHKQQTQVNCKQFQCETPPIIIFYSTSHNLRGLYLLCFILVLKSQWGQKKSFYSAFLGHEMIQSISCQSISTITLHSNPYKPVLTVNNSFYFSSQ